MYEFISEEVFVDEMLKRSSTTFSKEGLQKIYEYIDEYELDTGAVVIFNPVLFL